MKIKDSINKTNLAHKYIPDLQDDVWSITSTGDCEDYSFAVVWEYSDKNFFKFIKNIVSFRFRFWYVGVGPDHTKLGVKLNNGHFVTEYRKGKYFFDNNYRTLVDKELMEENGYNFKKSYTKFYILWRLLIGLKG